MTSKSVLTAILISTPLVLSSSSCPGGAYTVTLENGKKETFPLGVCWRLNGYSQKIECNDDGLLSTYQYTDNLCQIRNDSATQTAKIGEVEKGVTLSSIECNNACNCDYIEMAFWYVPANEKCGEAPKNNVQSLPLPRSQLNRCMEYSFGNGKTGSTIIEMSCTPDAKSGKIGTQKIFENADCSGTPIQSQDTIVRFGDVFGIKETPTSTQASCMQITHCDEGITNTAEPTCDNDNEFPWTILIISIIVFMAVVVTGTLIYFKSKIRVQNKTLLDS